jgi:hypothetical protein
LGFFEKLISSACKQRLAGTSLPFKKELDVAQVTLGNMWLFLLHDCFVSVAGVATAKTTSFSSPTFASRHA